MNDPKEEKMQAAFAEFLKHYVESGDCKVAQAVAFQVDHKDGTRGTVRCLVLSDSVEDSALALGVCAAEGWQVIRLDKVNVKGE